VWLLRALRDAVIAAVLTAVRGWLALLWRPLESSRLIATLPLNLWRMSRLLDELFGAGVIVATPSGDGDDRGLRTAIVGLGDLTTRVVEGSTLTSAVVTAHFDAVRERLVPLAATPEALFRASALGLVAMTAYLYGHTTFDARRLLDSLFDLLASAFLASFAWALLVRLAALLLRRGVQGWLARA
jgi:hypothetical protein